MEKTYYYFQKIAETGSLSQASEEIGVTQPALSKSIRLLEKKYGASFFTRNARGVELTEAGKALYDRVLRIEHELLGIKQDIATLNADDSVLRVGAGPAWEMPINNILPRFLLKYPNVSIEISSNTISQLIPKVVNGELDLALGGEDGRLQLRYNELSFIPLMDARVSIITANNHPLLQEKTRLSSLSHYPWVAYQQSSEMLHHINELLSRESINPIKFVLQTEFLQHALTMVQKSDALCCISSTLYRSLPADCDIQEIELADPIWSYHLGIWTKPSAQRGFYEKAFIEELKKEI